MHVTKIKQRLKNWSKQRNKNFRDKKFEGKKYVWKLLVDWHVADDVDEKDEELEQRIEQPAVGQLLPRYGAHFLCSNQSVNHQPIIQLISEIENAVIEKEAGGNVAS